MNNTTSALAIDSSVNTSITSLDACQSDKVDHNNFFDLVSTIEKAGVPALACLAILNIDESQQLTSKAVAKALGLVDVNTQTKGGKGACLSRVTAYIKVFPSNQTKLFLKTLVETYINDHATPKEFSALLMAEYVANRLAEKNIVWSSEKRDFKTLSTDKESDSDKGNDSDSKTLSTDKESDSDNDKEVEGLVYQESSQAMAEALSACQALISNADSNTRKKDLVSIITLMSKIIDNTIGENAEKATLEQLEELKAKYA